MSDGRTAVGIRHALGHFIRLAVLVAAACALTPQTGWSQQTWARKMFKVTEHDFGTVARGAKAEFHFEIENLYEETVHIAGVRTSCGCTNVSLTKDSLKTWEKGSVVATFNTQSFLGHRNATITVTIDKPYYAEVQLNVQGYIRSDVVFAPGAVEFGSVDAGATPKRKVVVSYAGRSDWKIVDVRSANSNFEVELSELTRGNGKVSYEMTVFLKPETPEGFIQDQLVVVTNDPRSSTVPLPVEGRVVSALTVSPGSLFMGILKPDQSIKKQLVIKGREPFRVTNVTCPDDRFEFKLPTEEKALHVIPVTFKGAATAEKVATTIEIHTTLSGATARCAATATIAAE